MTPGHSILIVRLGALGDIVHAIPAAAALRAALPSARIDWLVDAKHREILDLVTCIDRVVVLDRPTPAGWVSVTRELRGARYDAALDLQGLMKSAVLARASGAARVLGFPCLVGTTGPRIRAAGLADPRPRGSLPVPSNLPTTPVGPVRYFAPQSRWEEES